jgi:hypothetical protein
MGDKFFTQSSCDRCGDSLSGKTRTMSWFTEECICGKCSKEENEIKKRALDKGVDSRSLEGCGFIPKF